MATDLLALTQTATGLCRPLATPSVVTVLPAPAVSRPDPGSIPWQAGGRAGATFPSVAPTPAKRIDLHEGIRLSEVIGPLSQALDLAEGQAPGHAARSCMIGMRIGATLGLSPEHRSALFYALLLKDLGGSANSAQLASLFSADDHRLKRALKLTNWSARRDSTRYLFKHSFPGEIGFMRTWHSLKLGRRVKESVREMTATRCERGAELAVMLELPRGTAEAIRSIDEHWDGRGMPMGISGSGIPMLGRIVSLAQTVELFQHSFDVATAYEKAHERRGHWFDPVLMDCLDAFRLDTGFWHEVQTTDGLAQLRALEPEECAVTVDDERLEAIAEVFARVIDAKSRYTAQHSWNVADITVAAGEALALEARELRLLRRAALLHDVGKVGISNVILDKPSSLDPVEFELMRQHTRQTLTILKRVTRFRQFAATAAAHHERLDGSGYHLGLKGAELGMNARLLAVADVAEALSADRPYRAGLPVDEVARILRREVNSGRLCGDAVAAVLGTFAGLKVNAHAQVLNAEGQPIAGLYAAGNDMASLMGGHYPSGGITLGPAMTFGFVAGQHVLAASGSTGPQVPQN